MKQERIIYEEPPFYSLERVSKLRENEFGTHYLVKLAVVGAVWHSVNHWSNKVTMKRYITKVIVPYVQKNKERIKISRLPSSFSNL